MTEDGTKRSPRVLEPMDRISEILFGLIMVLTFTGAVNAAAAENIEVRTLVIAALGCNLAWGVIDGGVYLLARLNDQGRKIMTLRALRAAASTEAANGIIAGAMPPLLASVMPPEHLDAMRRRLLALPPPPDYPSLSGRDWVGALALCLLCFLSTFPVVIPLLLIGDPRHALIASHAVAILMLLFCGYAYGYRSGLRPWATALTMVVIAAVLAGIAIPLGG